MGCKHRPGPTSRRTFLHYLGLLGTAAASLFRSIDLRAALFEAQESADSVWPAMVYRKLGRTGFESSRLVFGCGSLLRRGRADQLLNRAFEAGINIFDVGSNRYYDKAETHLAPFLKEKRERIFLISKAEVELDVEYDEPITLQQAREAARDWAKAVDESLLALGVEHIDAYYLMASENPYIVSSEEFYQAFLGAKKAGKVTHFGLSTHENAHLILETAIKTGWYDLAQIAITPAGWYSWENRNILADSPPMVRLQPLLDRARKAGIGLIGMKAARHLAGRGLFSWRDVSVFDEHYDSRFLQSRLSPFQRSYAFVLAHGLDAVNSDMSNYTQLKENFTAAATAHQYFA